MEIIKAVGHLLNYLERIVCIKEKLRGVLKLMDKIDIIKETGIVITITLCNSLYGRKIMKINNININGVGGIKNLYLDFNNGLNLICGTNGIGKTTILEVISHAFGNDTGTLKKNVSYDKGTVKLFYKDENDQESSVEYYINTFQADKVENIYRMSSESLQVLYFKIDRRFDYKKIDGVKGDEIVEAYHAALGTNQGISVNDAKGWFINRQLFSKQEGSLSDEQMENLASALKVFSILDKNITYSRILGESLDILVNTPQGEIYLEYLSAGYKSCLFILLGIIKEIEYRFKEPRINVENFNGVVLIDEIDLHLHPEWQSELIRALKEMIPNAQIIATTHSPSILQSVLPNEIIALSMDERGDIYKKDLGLGEYGLQGWTIEEILTEVMGLNSTSSQLYQETIRAFDKAMDDEDIDEIKKNYKILDKMLHPNNPIKKILEIQMAGIKDDKSR